MTAPADMTRQQAESAGARNVRRQRLRTFVRHAILVAWMLVILFPIYWMVATSFKESGEWVAWPPHWIPEQPTLKNYSQIFTFDTMQKGLRARRPSSLSTCGARSVIRCSSARSRH